MKLESIYAEVFSRSVQGLIKCQSVTFFIQRTGIYQSWSCLWKGIMSRTKEITEDLGKRVDVAHQAKKLQNHLWRLDSTNPQSDRLCTNRGNSRPLFPSREVVDQQRSLQSRTCNSLRGCKSRRVTSKQLKVFLTLANVNVHEPTIREHWATTVCMADARRKPLFSKNKLLGKDHVDRPEDYWRKVNGWMKPK